jgi:hypothetical protein
VHPLIWKVGTNASAEHVSSIFRVESQKITVSNFTVLKASDITLPPLVSRVKIGKTKHELKVWYVHVISFLLEDGNYEYIPHAIGLSEYSNKLAETLLFYIV